MTTSDEVIYTVEVTSRFSAFLDDPLSSEDPTILLSKIQNERAEKRKEKIQQARERKTSHKTESNAGEQKVESNVVEETIPAEKAPVVSHDVVVGGETKAPSMAPRGRGGRGRGPPRGFNRGPRDARPMSRVQATGAEVSGETEQRPHSFNPRGFKPRGRGNFTQRPQRSRGSGAPHGFSNRPFERKEEEVEEASNEPTADVPMKNGVEERDSTEVTEEEKVPSAAPAPEEPVGYTLEEYRAMRSAAKSGSLQLESKIVRAPNDGKKVFENMVSHTKPVQRDASDDRSNTKIHEEVVNSPIEFSFNDRRSQPSERSRGGFRGARGSRGVPARGGRGSTRGFAGPSKHDSVAPPPINDDHEFPSLSK